MDGLKGIHGLNVDEGIRHCAGNQALYEKLLVKLASGYGDAPEQIRAFLEDGALEEAQRLAHSLKGVAGSLGAEELYEASDELNRSLKENIEGVEGALAEFSKTLTPLINALKVEFSL